VNDGSRSSPFIRDRCNAGRGDVGNYSVVLTGFRSFPAPAPSAAFIPCNPELFPVRVSREFRRQPIDIFNFLSPKIRQIGPENAQFPVIFPVTREFSPGDRFGETASTTRKSAQEPGSLQGLLPFARAVGEFHPSGAIG
jgi:hypothetical protein